MIKFKDIKEDNVAIRFDNSKELNKLVECLKILGYDYGTGRDNNIKDISDYLGISYFGKNTYLTLDRSRRYHPRNYVSCGKGYNATCYNFNEINWNIVD